jgi:hypothetical protein
MATPAVDYEGSGAIHYLRADATERCEIRLMLAHWAPYVEDSNAFTLPRTITITVPSIVKSDFEARENLTALRTAIRLGADKLTTSDLATAERALERLQSRTNEDVDTWADRLSTDLSLHRD